MMHARKREQRSRTIEEIKLIARRLMARDGASSLSLGAIARHMGMTTPALYRYFDGRDGLLTSLILDAYRDLGDETRRAVTDVDEGAIGERFGRIVTAYRFWAVAHPQEYVLIHGAVFNDYQVPIEEVAAASYACLSLFVDVLAKAEQAGTLRFPRAYLSLPHVFAQGLKLLGVVEDSVELPNHLVTLAFLVWLQAHGLVWQEISGHLPNALFRSGDMFRAQMRHLGESLGLIPTDSPIFVSSRDGEGE
jgi:AcrR family transcriptional regulator